VHKEREVGCFTPKYICRAPEQRRLCSCILIGHNYRPSAIMAGHSR